MYAKFPFIVFVLATWLFGCESKRQHAAAVGRDAAVGQHVAADDKYDVVAFPAVNTTVMGCFGRAEDKSAAGCFPSCSPQIIVEDYVKANAYTTSLIPTNSAFLSNSYFYSLTKSSSAPLMSPVNFSSPRSYATCFLPNWVVSAYSGSGGFPLGFLIPFNLSLLWRTSPLMALLAFFLLFGESIHVMLVGYTFETDNVTI